MKCLLLTLALVLGLCASGVLGWQVRRALHPREDLRFSHSSEDHGHDMSEIEERRRDTRGMLLGQMVIHEMRDWIGENAKTDTAPLQIGSVMWPPGSPWEVNLSRHITEAQEQAIMKRVEDLLAHSLLPIAGRNSFLPTHVRFYATRQPSGQNERKFTLEYRIADSPSAAPPANSTAR